MIRTGDYIILVVWNIFFHRLGIVIPTDFQIFQRGRYTTNQIIMSESWGYRCAIRFFWSMFDGREIGHPIWTHLELWKRFRGHPRQNCKMMQQKEVKLSISWPNHMWGDDRRSEVISQPIHCLNLMENMGCVQQGKGGRATIRYPKEPCDIPIVFLISAFERTIWTHIRIELWSWENQQWCFWSICFLITNAILITKQLGFDHFYWKSWWFWQIFIQQVHDACGPHAGGRKCCFERLRKRPAVAHGFGFVGNWGIGRYWKEPWEYMGYPWISFLTHVLSGGLMWEFDFFQLALFKHVQSLSHSACVIIRVSTLC